MKRNKKGLLMAFGVDFEEWGANGIECMRAQRSIRRNFAATLPAQTAQRQRRKRIGHPRFPAIYFLLQFR